MYRDATRKYSTKRPCFTYGSPVQVEDLLRIIVLRRVDRCDLASAASCIDFPRSSATLTGWHLRTIVMLLANEFKELYRRSP